MRIVCISLYHPATLPHTEFPCQPTPPATAGVGISTLTGEVRKIMSIIMQIDQVGS